MGRTEDIIHLMKTTGISREKCTSALLEAEGDIDAALDILGGKKKKERRLFNIGDIVICTNTKSTKLSQDAIDFLSTYKYFKIIDVNENKAIDIGYFTPDGKSFYFSPNRFELRDKPKEVPPPVEPKMEAESTRTPQDNAGQRGGTEQSSDRFQRARYDETSNPYEDSPDDFLNGWK